MNKWSRMTFSLDRRGIADAALARFKDPLVICGDNTTLRRGEAANEETISG